MHTIYFCYVDYQLFVSNLRIFIQNSHILLKTVLAALQMKHMFSLA